MSFAQIIFLLMVTKIYNCLCPTDYYAAGEATVCTVGDSIQKIGILIYNFKDKC